MPMMLALLASIALAPSVPAAISAGPATAVTTQPAATPEPLSASTARQPSQLDESETEGRVRLGDPGSVQDGAAPVAAPSTDAPAAAVPGSQPNSVLSLLVTDFASLVAGLICLGVGMGYYVVGRTLEGRMLGLVQAIVGLTTVLVASVGVALHASRATPRSSSPECSCAAGRTSASAPAEAAAAP